MLLLLLLLLLFIILNGETTDFSLSFTAHITENLAQKLKCYKQKQKFWKGIMESKWHNFHLLVNYSFNILRLSNHIMYVHKYVFWSNHLIHHRHYNEGVQ